MAKASGVDWMTRHHGWQEWLKPDSMIDLHEGVPEIKKLDEHMQLEEGDGLQHLRFTQKKRFDPLG